MRTFIAIDLPDNIRNEIQKLTDILRPTTSGMRWSRPEGLHITLKFIGEIPAAKVEEVRQRLGALPPFAPFSISVRDIGFFPRAKAPRAFWLGIKAGPELAALAQRIDDELARLGIAKEARSYSPHLTLGRVNGDDKLRSLQEILSQRGPLEMGTFAANEYFLYQSQLSPGGSLYTKLARFPLAGLDSTTETSRAKETP